MKKNKLVILASGKSSRFGGFPKAFCELQGKTVAQRTVDFASEFYQEIYLVVNKEVYLKEKDRIFGCTIVDIETGVGDAHSLLRALKKISASQKEGMDSVTVCWGDAVFIGAVVFERTSQIAKSMEEDSLGVAICALDDTPYAWFEVSKNKICSAHFAKNEGAVQQGIHDQSIFVFHLKRIISYLEKYKSFLHIGETNPVEYEEDREMKLLNAFAYFYQNGMTPMQYEMIEPGQVLSFNTAEELEEIKEQLS